MGLGTTDWLAILIFGAGALVGTFGKRSVRITGFVVMAVAIVGLVLSLSFSQSQSVPSWNASGQDWRCSEICAQGLTGHSTKIAQSGRTFILTNESEKAASGVYQDGHEIRVPTGTQRLFSRMT
jgi:hypothetical protein